MSQKPEPAGRVREAGAVVFALVLTVFAAVIVVSAFDLRPAPRLVPLVIGIPTLIGTAYFAVRAVVGEAPPSPEEEPDEHVDIGRASLSALAGMAAKEVEEDTVLPMDEVSVRKRRVFVLWAVLVLAIAWVFDFYVAMVVGLVGIYAYSRIGWWKTILITALLVGSAYATFDFLLGVRF